MNLTMNDLISKIEEAGYAVEDVTDNIIAFKLRETLMFSGSVELLEDGLLLHIRHVRSYYKNIDNTFSNLDDFTKFLELVKEIREHEEAITDACYAISNLPIS